MATLIYRALIRYDSFDSMCVSCQQTLGFMHDKPTLHPGRLRRREGLREAGRPRNAAELHTGVHIGGAEGEVSEGETGGWGGLRVDRRGKRRIGGRGDHSWSAGTRQEGARQL